MKKSFVLFAALAIVLGFILSCEKKNNSNAIAPDYGATGNPYPNNQTVTGSTSFTNPATENTSLQVGGSGWSNYTCLTTGSLTLRGYSGNTDVTLSFASAATSGTYAVSTQVASGVCAMTITNAPNQPAGTVWVGKSGIVTVITTTSSIRADFTNIVCTQQTFNFPNVSASGFLVCGQ
jgi:hypothetical protein